MGAFAIFDDVQAEFEGVMPMSKEDWVDAKIDAVESRLIGLVPSLAVLTQTSEPARFSRVKHLVVEKVLHLFRNPAGATQQVAGPFSTTLSAVAGSGAINFTAEELATIRQRTKKANLGMATIAPWRAERSAGVLRQW